MTHAISFLIGGFVGVVIMACVSASKYEYPEDEYWTSEYDRKRKGE